MALITKPFNITGLLCACTLLVMGAQQPVATGAPKGPNFTIQVTDKPNDTVIVGYYTGSAQYVYDTFFTDKKGRFSVKREESIPGGLYLIAFPNSGYFEFVYTGEENKFFIKTSLSNPVDDMKVKGSNENKVFNEFQVMRKQQGVQMDTLQNHYTRFKKQPDSVKAIRKRLETMDKAHKEIQKEFARSHPGTLTADLVNLMRVAEIPEPKPRKDGKPVDSAMFRYVYIKQHYWDYVNFSNEDIIRTPLYKNKVFRYLGPSYTPQHPDSISKWAIKVIDLAYEGHPAVFKSTLTWITTKYQDSDVMGMDAVFTELAARYYLTDKVTWISEEDRSRIRDRYNKTRWNKIDAKAQNLVMVDNNGVPRALDFVDTDYTLLYFYSATCGHCKEMTPKIYKIYQEYKDKGFGVFAVSTDFEDVTNDEGEVINYKVSQEWLDYVEENGFDWINVSDPFNQTNFRTYYDVYSTPVLYLLDKDKHIIGKRIDDVSLRRLLMRNIDGMSHEEIDAWMEENGYNEQEEE